MMEIKNKSANLLFFTVLFLSELQSQTVDTFMVKGGQTSNINQPLTRCTYFVMEDSSTLTIDVPTWTLESDFSVIGSGCKIIGQGTAGTNASDKKEVPRNANKGRNGAHGFDGDSGGDAGNGKDVVISTAFLEIGSLTIDVKGGSGGSGGRGGNGGKGGGKKYSNGTVSDGGGHGGDGGKGGAAGRGGNGGIVIIKYCNTEDNYKNPGDKIKILVSRGSNGAPGEGGEGGDRGGDKSPGAKGSKGDLASGEGTDGSASFTPVGCDQEEGRTSHALIIWESEYEKAEPEWEKQADSLATLLEQKYAFDHVERMNNPTISEIQARLIEYTELGSSEDVFVVISGHGNKLGSNIYGFLDTNGDNITFDAIYGIARRANVRSLLLVLNCCYSGKILSNEGVDISTPTNGNIRTWQEVNAGKGIAIITAGFEEQKVDTKLIDGMMGVLNDHAERSIGTEKPLTTSRLFLKLLTTGGLESKDRPTLGIISPKLNLGEFIFKPIN